VPTAEQAFNPPPSFAGMKVLSYFDEVNDLGMAGRIFNWGFIVTGDTDEVRKKLLLTIINSDKLVTMSDGGFFRDEKRVDAGNEWELVEKPKLNQTVGVLSTERIFLIEPNENRPHTTRVYCSLQGAVGPGILRIHRPDINPVDYPPRIRTFQAEDIPTFKAEPNPARKLIKVSGLPEPVVRITDQTMRNFVSCDGSFFKNLHQLHESWGKSIPMQNNNDVAWIQVKDPNHRSTNEIVFSNPLEFAGFRVVSYFDSRESTKQPDGKVLNVFQWGFRIVGDWKTIRSKFRALVPDTLSLALTSENYPVDIWNNVLKMDDQWKVVFFKNPKEAIENESKAARSFYTGSAEKDYKGTTNVGCTLKGFDSAIADVLAEIRPDISASR
jgi:hypothetical protein